MKYIILSIIASLLCVLGNAQVKYSNEFLAIGVGARQMSMANSVVASTGDVYSGYWNPAGLLQVTEDIQLGYMHSEYFAGIAKYDFLGGAFNLGDSAAMGISMIRFAVDDIPNTLELYDKNKVIHYDRVTSFSAADWAFLISYARKLPKHLNIGANAKIIYRSVGEFATAWGFGIDAGLQYDYNGVKFGAMFRDVTTTFNAWSFNTETFEEVFLETGNEIPENSIEQTMPRLILGGGKVFTIKEHFTVMPELGFDFTFDGKRNVLVRTDFMSIDPHFGFELGYRNIVFVRGGVGNIQQVPDFDNNDVYEFQPSMGVGLKIKRFTLDYAYTDVADQSIALNSHVISLSYGIVKK